MLTLVKRFKAYREAEKIKRSDILKKKMCQAAIEANLCSNNCYCCAWNTKKDTDE